MRVWPRRRAILRNNAEAYTCETESKALAKSTGTKSPLSIVLHDACTSNKWLCRLHPGTKPRCSGGVK